MTSMIAAPRRRRGPPAGRLLWPIAFVAWAVAGLAQPPAPPPTSAPRPSEPVRRFPLAGGPGTEFWPAPAPLRVVRSPDWSNYNVYPMAARRREQEGVVSVELRVGADGTPIACRIFQSSNHVELDDGTCDLGLQMRFAPVPAAVYRMRLVWLLADRTRLGPARLTATLDLDLGQVVRCTLAVTGAVPREWRRAACRIFTAEAAHFLAASPFSARRAVVLVELQPDGEAPLAQEEPAGRLIASRRTLFELARNGDVRNCRTPLNQGFGARTFDYSGPCGVFLTQVWFARAHPPHSGAMELRVYVAPDPPAAP